MCFCAWCHACVRYMQAAAAPSAASFTELKAIERDLMTYVQRSCAFVAKRYYSLVCVRSLQPRAGDTELPALHEHLARLKTLLGDVCCARAQHLRSTEPVCIAGVEHCGTNAEHTIAPSGSKAAPQRERSAPHDND